MQAVWYADLAEGGRHANLRIWTVDFAHVFANLYVGHGDLVQTGGGGRTADAWELSAANWYVCDVVVEMAGSWPANLTCLPVNEAHLSASLYVSVDGGGTMDSLTGAVPAAGSLTVSSKNLAASVCDGALETVAGSLIEDLTANVCDEVVMSGWCGPRAGSKEWAANVCDAIPVTLVVGSLTANSAGLGANSAGLGANSAGLSAGLGANSAGLGTNSAGLTVDVRGDVVTAGNVAVNSMHLAANSRMLAANTTADVAVIVARSVEYLAPRNFGADDTHLESESEFVESPKFVCAGVATESRHF